MKVLELFESSEEKSVHARVYRAVLAFALSRIKVDAETRSAANYEAENDRFWSSSVDEVTHQVEKYIADPSDDRLEYLLDAFVECVDQISDKIVSYYSNAWNHEPGFKKPKVTYPSVEDIRDTEMIKVLHTAVSEFKVSHDVHQNEKKAEKKAFTKARNEKVTPEFLQQTGAFLSKKWSAAFAKPSIKEMQRKPAYWTDWFTVEQIKAFKTPADVEAAFKTDRDKLEWVLNSGRGFPKDYDLMAYIINTPAIAKKLVPLIPELRK
jgi:hypothetical protein